MKELCSVTALVKDGKAELSEAQKKILASVLVKHEGKYVRLSVSNPGRTRSNNQNSYYWGVVLTMIAAEVGHSTEDLHDYFRETFLPRSYISIAGKEIQVRKSTTLLDTLMFEGYLESIRAFAATELNMIIPLPNEIATPSLS